MVNSSGNISTFAGNGIPGFSGNGGQATNAELDYPVNVCTDASGNVFIADYFNNRVRQVHTNGIISTYAGNGTAGFAGDGGAASSAELDWPDGIAIDASGNMFISDEVNVRIRLVNSSGIISTIAGNGIQGFTGDGGPATSAEMDNILNVSIDKYGNAYVSDYTNDRVRVLSKVTTGEGQLSVISGQWSVYPNPNNGRFNLVVSSQWSVVSSNTIEVFDIMGEEVFKETLTPQSSNSIDLSGKAKGIYLYRVFSAEGKQVAAGKFVVE